MKLVFYFLIIASIQSCYGEFKQTSITDMYINRLIEKYDTVPQKKVFYGYAGIEFDSSKFYFHKFIFYQDKMNKSQGRTFARYEDSCMRYKLLLDRLAKK
jgi:hypothetical protein